MVLEVDRSDARGIEILQAVRERSGGAVEGRPQNARLTSLKNRQAADVNADGLAKTTHL
jgi:hypothetical protein